MSMHQMMYLAFVDYDSQSDGVAKKVKMQIKALEQNGHNVECAAYGKDGVCIFKGSQIVNSVSYNKNKMRRFQLLKFTLDYIKQNAKDVLYIRFAYSDPKMYSFLRKARKYVAKIIIEIATYPYRYKRTFFRDKRTWVIQAIDRIYLPRISKYVDKYYVIGEPVDTICGVRATNIPNGIVDNSFSLKSGNIGEDINIMCLANMYIYQGYDRLICGLNEYKKRGGSKKITIHLVGDGPEIDKYRQLTNQYKLNEEVIFHGQKDGKDLEALFEICNVACSTLAPHRNQIIYASPLKSKEYMLRGIPYIYAYKEIGIENPCEYIKHIESNDAPIDMELIIAFFDSYKNDMINTSIYLRNYAVQNFSWENIFKNICN